MIAINNCSGCSGCANVCPKNAISMITDSNGFQVPSVDKDLCVNCNLCNRVCPQINIPDKHDFEQKAYAAYSKDIRVRTSSSSGGIFTVLSDWVLEQGGYVAGVRMDKDLQVRFYLVETKSERDTFKKSKYVQASVGLLYRQIKEKLLQGKMVLFAGLPCQVSALRLFLGKEYASLICIDFLCFGMASQKLFDDYIKYLEKKKNKKIVSYQFRARDEFKGWEKNINCIEYEDGSEEIVKKIENLYDGLFSRCIAHTDACYVCQYKNLNRVGDMSLGDFYFAEKVFPTINPKDGVSLVFVNSEKGYNLWNLVSGNVESYNCSLNELPYRKVLNTSNKPYRFRKQFFEAYKKRGFQYACFWHVTVYRVLWRIPIIKKIYH